MNIDKIEKMDKFPSFINYLKQTFITSFEWILLIMFSIGYFFSVGLAAIFFIIYLIFEYFIDKRIFTAFENRRERKNELV